ncbi:bifunctional diaminohydroxyphosphoribosylaminopyrimidine deaminase/5-amino-6-(5-phosphoribosylamino)uracil reductase RibD [Maricaulaceae bacterium EIL42A08]|nr:bifunctional diaminohydroxyphosphoribosylaminopyrimidine deaminase/5-amino-6-(5-phosphoribosylamino)uracil reductase RibD [Maricaulaceae bacterium EIL42A08]
MSPRELTPDDWRYMDVALSLAFAGLGRTAPNPSVGCVIVKDERIVGTGHTAPGGRPHAEPQALAMAGEAAAGATAYVTLEPCAHHGVTPPCAEALVSAQIGEVVIACLDPFHLVDGRGVDILNAAGIPVVTGVREHEAIEINAGFFSLLRDNRPLVVRDKRRSLYDADLQIEPGQSMDDALEAAAARRLTRLRQS